MLLSTCIRGRVEAVKKDYRQAPICSLSRNLRGQIHEFSLKTIEKVHITTQVAKASDAEKPSMGAVT